MTGHSLADFYSRHPYPQPETNLDAYRDGSGSILGSPDRFGRLLFPQGRDDKPLDILIAGCGTSQAAKYALLNASARVTAIDVSPLSLEHTRRLKANYQLDGLSIHELPLEQVAILNKRFDLIVSTGVLHHLDAPSAGLKALADVLRPDGVMHLMVYAQYGRTGVYLLQEYARRLHIQPTDEGIAALQHAVRALPNDHPVNVFAKRTDDFRYPAGVADALLHPCDRAYTVPELMEWLGAANLTFDRWLLQAPYRSTCAAGLPVDHAESLTSAVDEDEYAALELWRGNLITHEFLCIGQRSEPRWNWSTMIAEEKVVVERFPGARTNRIGLPKNVAAQLWHPAHKAPDLLMSASPKEVALVESADEPTTHSPTDALKRLWHHDQVIVSRQPSA